MLRKSLLALVMALPLFAEPVYFSPNGKVFHKTEKCNALRRTKNIYTANRSDAESHGMKECHWRSCWPTEKAGKPKGKNAEWGKPVE